MLRSTPWALKGYAYRDPKAEALVPEFWDGEALAGGPAGLANGMRSTQDIHESCRAASTLHQFQSLTTAKSHHLGSNQTIAEKHSLITSAVVIKVKDTVEYLAFQMVPRFLLGSDLKFLKGNCVELGATGPFD